MRTSEKLQELGKEFRAIPYARAAIAYGSFARSDIYSERSDIDISVFLEGNYITQAETHLALSKLNPKYDISPHSVAETTGVITNIHDPDFYEHVINNYITIFDDCAAMANLKSCEGIRNNAEQKLGMRHDSISKMSFYLLRARRRCYRLCKWIPQYGLIEPVISDIFAFKSGITGFMRSALKAEGIKLGKDDYKEVVISRFCKQFPKFHGYDIQFDMRDPSYEGFSPANAFISSHLLDGSAWHDLEELDHRDIIKLVNGARRLLEFEAGCVNESLLERLED